jgi:hypothetical protein
MLANKDLYGDMEKLEKLAENETDTATLLRAVLKAQMLTVKLLHNLRTNSVSVMKKYGIELVKPATVDKDGKKIERPARVEASRE